MERRQGFFSSLKGEMARGLLPARSSKGRSGQSHSSAGSGQRRRSGLCPPEIVASRSGILRPGGETLSPLMEGPDLNGSDSGDPKSDGWAQWLCRVTSGSDSGLGYSKPNLKLLLDELGAPPAPVHVSNVDPLPQLCIKDTPVVPRQQDDNHCGHFVCCYIEDIINTYQTIIPDTFVHRPQLASYNYDRMHKYKMDWIGYFYNWFLYSNDIDYNY